MRAPRRRGVSLVAHLRGQLRILRGGFADEARLPDIVGEGLLAIDVLAMRQRQIGGKRMRVLRRGHHDGIEIVGPIEDAPEVRKFPRLRVTLRRGIERELVDVAKHGDILIRMRPCWAARIRTAFLPFGAARPGTTVSSARLALPRPPQAMNAMFSLLFRFWPRRNAGAR